MRTLGLSVLALAACAGAASATNVPQVVVSSNLFSDTSLVPFGFEDERFSTDLSSLYRSPDGGRWICAFSTSYGRRGIMTGQGRLFEIPILVTGSEELPWSTEAEPAIYDSGIDLGNAVYAINNAGDIAITLVERTAPPTRVIMKRVGGVWSHVLRQGEDVPYVGGDEAWGAAFFPFAISQDGSQVSFRATGTVGSLLDTQDDFTVFGSTVFQVGVTPVPGFPARTFNNIGSSQYMRSAEDLSKWIAYGEMSGATTDNEVMITHNGVLAQETNPFAGITIRTTSRMGGASISGNGLHTTFRGQTNASNTDFCAFDNTLAAVKGNPVPGIASTTWNSFTGFSRTFLNSDVNDFGEWAILGGTTTSGVNVGRIVTSFAGPVLSDRDPVDLDGDGIAADGVYADINGGTGSELQTMVLGNDHAVFAVVRLVDSPVPASGSFLGEALIRIGDPISTCSPCPADFDFNGGVDGGDLGAFFNDFEQGLPCADVDQNGGVDGGDLAAFFIAFEAGGC